jgi:hypothetical protein
MKKMSIHNDTQPKGNQHHDAQHDDTQQNGTLLETHSFLVLSMTTLITTTLCLKHIT